jgi:SAF domain-containing protein
MADNPEGLPVRRQWGRLAIGLSVALLGGWLFAALYLSAGSRESVVVLARDVQAFQQLTEDDLTTERVAAGDRVDTIPGDQIDELLNHVMRTSLPAGSVLVESQLVAEGDVYELIGEGNRLAAMYLSRSEVPAGLQAGDPVQIALSADVDEDEPVDDDEDEICGGVAYVGRMDERTGNRQVNVIVPAEDFVRIGPASAEGDASLARRADLGDTSACDDGHIANGWGVGSSGSSGSNDTGSADTGSADTGSDETGSGETGSGETDGGEDEG